jgi:hypothetical protein
MVEKPEIDNKIEVTELGEIILEVGLHTPEVLNLAMLEKSVVDVLRPSFETQDVGPELGQKRTDLAVPSAQREHRLKDRKKAGLTTLPASR